MAQLTRLERYFAACQRCRFRYGQVDCLVTPADWVIFAGGPDIAARWRGTYSTRAGALRIVRGAGGMLAFARQACAAAGLAEIDPAAAVSGDIGVGRVGETDWGLNAPTGLIRAGGYWAALTARAGLVIGPATMLAAWRVEGKGPAHA